MVFISIYGSHIERNTDTIGGHSLSSSQQSAETFSEHTVNTFSREKLEGAWDSTRDLLISRQRPYH